MKDIINIKCQTVSIQCHHVLYAYNLTMRLLMPSVNISLFKDHVLINSSISRYVQYKPVLFIYPFVSIEIY